MRVEVSSECVPWSFAAFFLAGSFHFIRLVFLSASLSAYHLSAFANLSPAYVCHYVILFYFCFLWFRSHVFGSWGYGRTGLSTGAAFSR